jgi:hypothetical protein
MRRFSSRSIFDLHHGRDLASLADPQGIEEEVIFSKPNEQLTKETNGFESTFHEHTQAGQEELA